MARRKGQTPIKHALEWLEDAYPGAPVEKAKRSVIWTGTKHISKGEDIFGVFDLMALPRTGVVLVQVTTWTGGGGVALRRRKIVNWIENHYPGVFCAVAAVWVIAWVPRKHFRRWKWDWAYHQWQEEPSWAQETQRSPEPSRP